MPKERAHGAAPDGRLSAAGLAGAAVGCLLVIPIISGGGRRERRAPG